MEDKILTLPWLADKKQPEDEEEKRPEGKFGEPAFKPYVSGQLYFKATRLGVWGTLLIRLLNL